MENAATGVSLPNSAIAELLAIAAEHAKMPLQKALRRASRKAFMWTEEAVTIVQDGRSLTELPAVGPSLSRMIRNWIEDPPSLPRPPEIRAHFNRQRSEKDISEESRVGKGPQR